MVNDSTSWVRVREWYKTVSGRDPVTNEKKDYELHLDWDFGTVESEEGTIYVLGAPQQLFSVAVYGDALTDGRVLVTKEKLRLSTLEGEAAMAAPFDRVHFKHPNI